MEIKEANKRIDELLSLLFDPSIPDLYHRYNKNGQVFRKYSFIRGNSEYRKRIESGKLPEININDIGKLTNLKSSIENELRDRRDLLSEQHYSLAVLTTRNWLRGKLQNIFRAARQKGVSDPITDNIKEKLLSNIALTICDIFHGITLGVEPDNLKERLNSLDGIHKKVIINTKYGSFHFNFSELVDKTGNQDLIKPIISESIDLYFKYLSVVKKINEWQSKLLFDSLKEDRRGQHMKDRAIVPEERFYKIVDEFANPITDKGINSNLVDKLINKKHTISGEKRLLVGYRANDEEKKNPKKLTESTARRRIDDYLNKSMH